MGGVGRTSCLTSTNRLAGLPRELPRALGFATLMLWGDMRKVSRNEKRLCRPTAREGKSMEGKSMDSKAAADAALPGKRHRLSPPHTASAAIIPTSILWYRDFDLRTHDHQPLTHAAVLGVVVPVFIWPPKHERGILSLGGAAQVKTASCAYMHPSRVLPLSGLARTLA